MMEEEKKKTEQATHRENKLEDGGKGSQKEMRADAHGFSKC